MGNRQEFILRYATIRCRQISSKAKNRNLSFKGSFLEKTELEYVESRIGGIRVPGKFSNSIFSKMRFRAKRFDSTFPTYFHTQNNLLSIIFCSAGNQGNSRVLCKVSNPIFPKNEGFLLSFRDKTTKR